MFNHMSNSISYSHPKWDLWMVAALVCVAYDRIAHFAVGWFAFPLAELFFRKNWVKSAGFAAFFTPTVCQGGGIILCGRMENVRAA